MQQVVGGYVVEGELARGGQGVVLRAHDARTGRPAAVKLLLEPHDEVAARRFEREARALEALSHPSLVRVLAHGVDRGRPYLAMERVEGVDLGRRLATGGPPPPAWTARTLAAVARALEACHARGVVHRDVKPQNILIEHGTERPVLVDFGLVRRDPGRASLEGASSRLTLSGEVMGTPSFMPPEQADGGAAFGPVGPPADVHALGATLYTLLTGQPPFNGPTVVSVLAQVLERVPPPPRALAPDVPAELDALCVRALAKQPAERPTAAELAAALEAFASGRRARPAARRARRAARGALAALAVVVVVVVALALVLSRAPDAPPDDAAPAPPSITTPPARALPALPDGWRAVWRLGAGDAARPDAPSLWLDPTTAAPLAGVAEGSPDALAAAFDGPASPRPGGRVVVRYDADALRPEVTANSLLSAPSAGAPLVSATDHETRLLAPNDGGFMRLRLGGPWLAPAVRLSAREVNVVDYRQLTIWIGAPGRSIALCISGRAGRLLLDGPSPTWTPFALGPTPRRLTFAPWAPPGRRVLLDEAPVEALDALPGRTPPAGEVVALLTAGEVDLLVSDLEVEGVPRRVDRPALARPPAAALGPSARIAGAFEREAAASSGPVLALGDASVELAGEQLVLRSGDDILGVATVNVALDAPGWLLLERSPGTLRAMVVMGQGIAAVAGADPFGAPTDDVGFGSTGPRVRWTDVEVGGAPAAPLPAGLEAWRAGARQLAQLSCPRRFDGWLAGRSAEQREARATTARVAAERLERAAEELSGAPRRDALARSLLAWVLAAEPARARALLAPLGPGAGPAVDEVLRAWEGRPMALDWLADGWVEADRGEPALRAAALDLAWDLAPSRRAGIAFERGIGAAFLARSSSGRARQLGFEEALRRYDEALVQGASAFDVAAGRAEALHELGRLEEALAAWDLAVQKLDGPSAWNWLQRAGTLTALGRLDGAVESAIRALACSQGLAYVQKGLRDLASSRREPTAVAILGLFLLDRRQDALAEAARRARPASERDRDILAYVLGEPPPPGDRPTRALALARLGDPAARASLEAAAEADPLVRSVILLDPSLRGP